jgi:hypothetical protein
MTRTKTRQHPAPRRTRADRTVARASRKEVKFPIPGHALGPQACLMMRRKAARWSVTDSFRGAPAYVGAGEVWMELKPDTPDGDLYCWSEGQARALAARFVEQAIEIHRNSTALLAAARRIEALAAAMAPKEPLPPVLTLHHIDARLREAQAEVDAQAKVAAPVKPAGFTVPAAIDHPDYQPESPDPVAEVKVLSLKAQGISANSEQDTIPLDVSRIHGPDDTAMFQMLPDLPPMPSTPPTVHLDYLAETHPDAGDRIRASVAEAMAAAS